jgi:hypothetical protein
MNAIPCSLLESSTTKMNAACTFETFVTVNHLQATHLFKESTALSTFSIVLLKHVVVIINYYRTYCGRSRHHWVCRCLGRVYLVLICIPCTCCYFVMNGVVMPNRVCCKNISLFRHFSRIFK